MKKLVYVCSPFRGDIRKNIANARKYAKYVIQHGHIPFVPHLLFTQFTNDLVAEERALGMAMGKEMMKKCDYMWVFGDEISKGMEEEINFWRFSKGRQVVFVNPIVLE